MKLNVFKFDNREFWELKTSIDFLDLTLTVKNEQIITTIYENPQNLYQYLPLHSCHAPGIAKDMIYGMVNRAFDRQRKILTNLLQTNVHPMMETNILGADI